MSISTTPPPPPPPKKKGLGCLGCGCLILVLLAILFAALVGGVLYMGYNATLRVTSTTPAVIPSFAGSDDLYQTALRKLADFDHDVKNHQAATVRLSADEINVLITRNPEVSANHIQAFVSFSNTEGRVQASVPADALGYGVMKGRFFNLDTSFEIYFDQATKTFNVIPHTLKFGDNVLMGPNAADDRTAQSFKRTFTPFLNQLINAEIQKSPDGTDLLNQAKSIEIQDGQLVIETQ